MIGDQKTGRFEGIVVSASANQGLIVSVGDRTARLAIITEDGHIHAAGDAVEKEVFAVSVNAYRDFLRAEGHLRTRSRPM